ncbi:hypothetical protein [Nocardia brasiliensis]|uniref:hypothetical protein n=1 Tax=Nocardia brasiliensis TaxID=37326 RepID=UPI0004A732B6|nr:hypothetical protein [Nocardia brasiliensis]
MRLGWSLIRLGGTDRRADLFRTNRITPTTACNGAGRSAYAASIRSREAGTEPVFVSSSEAQQQPRISKWADRIVRPSVS